MIHVHRAVTALRGTSRPFPGSYRLLALALFALLAGLLFAAGHASQALAAGAHPHLPLLPDKRLTLTAGQWAQDAAGGTLDSMFPSNGFAMHHPILVWWFALELLGLAVFPLTFLLLGNLLDCGFVVAKTLGLLLCGYLVWIAVSLGVATFDRGIVEVVFALLILVGLILYARLWTAISAGVRDRWRFMLAGEVIFLVAFAGFVLLRMWYPDLGHQFSPVAPDNIGAGRMGEKQMELAYLNAIVRSRVFPPLDPFYAGGYINYYYYGFFLVGLLCKLTQIMPATGFNLAIATFAAVLAGGVFSVGLSLTRRVTPGVIASLFVVALGNLGGAWQLVQDLMSVATVHSSIPFIGGMADVLSGARAVLFDHQTLPAFDFWGPTRIVPPGDISEFPYFTFLFADLHPHLMAYSMTALALLAAVNLSLGVYTNRSHLALALLLGGVVLGSLAVTNPWDFPTYLLVVGLGAAVGTFVGNRRISRDLFIHVGMWLLAPAVLAYVLFLPFKRQYQTVFATGVGLVRDITPAMLQPGMNAAQMHDAWVTPLSVYLEHFGLFLFAILSFILLLFWKDAQVGEFLRRARVSAHFLWYYREHFPRAWRAQRLTEKVLHRRTDTIDPAVLIGALILVVGLAVFQYFLLSFLFAVLGVTLLLLQRLFRRLPAEQLFILSLLVIPLMLSIGTQIVFVKDWLAGGSMFRMNTIFKFYNQAWVLFGTIAAVSLSFFMDGALQRVGTRMKARRPHVHREALNAMPFQALAPATVVSQSAIRVEGMGGAGETSAPDAPVAARAVRVPSPLRQALARPIELFDRYPWWSIALALLVVCSLIYTYAGTVARETYRTTWLPENSVPLTLDGMAFMKLAYPQDYAGIQWLNAHVAGAQVVAEAGNAYYDWRSRVSMFTGLPTILNGIHEPEQRFGDAFGTRSDDLQTLYNSPDPAIKMQMIRRYDVRYIFVGFSETQCAQYQCFSRAGLREFPRMVGHGLTVAFHRPGITIYQVSNPR